MSDVLGNGAKLAYSTDGTTFTDFAGVLSIKPSKPTRGKIDNTALDSTNKTNLAGIPDYGSADFEIKHAPATAGTIWGWFTAGTEMYFRVTLNDAITSSTGTPTKCVYKGFVESAEPVGAEVKLDEIVKQTITISINALTFTAAT